MSEQRRRGPMGGPRRGMMPARKQKTSKVPWLSFSVTWNDINSVYPDVHFCNSRNGI